MDLHRNDWVFVAGAGVGIAAVGTVLILERKRVGKHKKQPRDLLKAEEYEGPSVAAVVVPGAHLASISFLAVSQIAGLYSAQHFASIKTLRRTALACAVATGAMNIVQAHTEGESLGIKDQADGDRTMWPVRHLHLACILPMIAVEFTGVESTAGHVAMYAAAAAVVVAYTCGKHMNASKSAVLGSWVRRLSNGELDSSAFLLPDLHHNPP